MSTNFILFRFVRGLARLTGNHCLLPSLRNMLFRISGIKIGKRAFVNMGINVVDSYFIGMIEIGERASIAPNVNFIACSDPNDSTLSQNPRWVTSGKIEIGSDTWIGTGVTILPGIKIGNMSIVGSNTLCTKDVPDYSIVTGIPGRVRGWICKCTEKLEQREKDKYFCHRCDATYTVKDNRIYPD